MTTYLVIGLYSDGQTYAEAVEAAGPLEAMIRVANDQRDADMEIVGAVEGLTLHAPSDESGCSAHVRDLRTIGSEQITDEEICTCELLDWSGNTHHAECDFAGEPR